MSTRARLGAAALTDEIPTVDEAACECTSEGVHRWSAPVVDTVDTVGITRWRCTCPHCQCDGLHLTVDPTETGTPQHLAVDEDSESVSGLSRFS